MTIREVPPLINKPWFINPGLTVYNHNPQKLFDIVSGL